MTFDFDITLSLFYFSDPNRIFLGSVKGSKTVMGSTHVVEQHSFSIITLILTFEFDSIFGSFFTFCALMGYFWVAGKVQKLFRSLPV